MRFLTVSIPLTVIRFMMPSNQSSLNFLFTHGSIKFVLIFSNTKHVIFVFNASANHFPKKKSSDASDFFFYLGNPVKYFMALNEKTNIDYT